MKSRADWQLETSLLRELVDTVTQRSTIVESIETDRLRYSQRVLTSANDIKVKVKVSVFI